MDARVLIGTLLLSAMLVARADPDPRRFDGNWDLVLSCPNSNGALGYSFKFDVLVKDGVLHAEKGMKGEPGWLSIDGKIPADGHASLYADGLVGAAEAAVGHRPAGTRYGYHIETQFNEQAGEGHRVEGRPCNAEFSKTR